MEEWTLVSVFYLHKGFVCPMCMAPPYCCRKGDPFQGPKLGSCLLTLGNELSEETHVLTKQEILLGKCAQAQSMRVSEPRRTSWSHGLQSRVLWWWDYFPGCLTFLVVHTLFSMAERRVPGGGRICGVSFWPLPNSSGWWRLISCVPYQNFLS